MKMMIKNLETDNKGMTMVEVLMGFLILSIILGGVVTLISFSSNMYFKSVDKNREQTELMQNAYREKESAALTSGSGCKVSTVGTEADMDIEMNNTSRYEISNNAYVFYYSKP